jgi:hypothetical protein
MSLGRARHFRLCFTSARRAVCAVGCQPTRSAGRGLPALPAPRCKIPAKSVIFGQKDRFFAKKGAPQTKWGADQMVLGAPLLVWGAALFAGDASPAASAPPLAVGAAAQIRQSASLGTGFSSRAVTATSHPKRKPPGRLKSSGRREREAWIILART